MSDVVPPPPPPPECPACGARLEPGQRACVECGRTLRQRYRRGPSWRVTAAGASVLLAALGVGAGFGIGSLAHTRKVRPQDVTTTTPTVAPTTTTAPPATTPTVTAPTTTAPPATTPTVTAPTTTAPTTTQAKPPATVPGRPLQAPKSK